MKLEEFSTALNQLYLKDFDTKILGGFKEPFYKAAVKGQNAEIQFRDNYFSSALHELAHWCIAGKKRREKDDFDYWYVPDGRNQIQQNLFYKTEVKPQALEWSLSLICETPFSLSLDNLNEGPQGLHEFEKSVTSQIHHYIKSGYPKRAGQILQLLGGNSYLKIIQHHLVKGH